MHLLATSTASIDELAEPLDLRQPPGELVALSFTDSDLAGLAAAWRRGPGLPSLRLARLKDLAHPMSVDLWIDGVAAHAKVVLVRLLGGLEWWRYGVDRLAALARARRIALAVLPGEDRDDPRLAAASTVEPEELQALLACFREGGPANMDALLARLARLAGREAAVRPAEPVPRAAGYLPGVGAVDLARLVAATRDGRPVVPVLFYRSMWLADDAAPVDALAQALDAQGLSPAPMMVASLKDEASAAFVRRALAELSPAAVVTATGFAAGEGSPLAGLEVPLVQAVVATTLREAWVESPRGLAAADLAMHVVLPELDGRLLAGAISLKAPQDPDELLAFSPLANRPEPALVEAAAARIAALVRLGATPRAERRLAVLIPDYPGARGRAGYAVGLDVPASVLALLEDLRAEGYRTGGIPGSSRALLDSLNNVQTDITDTDMNLGAAGACLSLQTYCQLLATIPPASRAAVEAAWGAPEADPDVVAGAFRFRAARFGKVTVALPPDRGRGADRRADYHDPALPPRHALLAFGLWLRHVAAAQAIVHMGAHGTLEWLPGKSVALTPACFPSLVAGELPVIYPFIVSNPGEAAQAKRRLAAVTIGHLTPPMLEGAAHGEAAELEGLVEEFALADGLDRRRRDRLARLIQAKATATDLGREAGLTEGLDPDEALKRLDAWLCDLKELALKDGLHVFGRDAPGEADPARLTSAARERQALLDALDGRHVAPGPAGAPGRGRADVLPTGRNLVTADPRVLPTPTAMDLARLAAEEVIRAHAQEHGEPPRALVLDLWGSATLRTGGEEIAQGLAFLGCRPLWDAASGRVTGVEVLPTAVLGRPRVDVTFRISGLFRDVFPAQIALLDAAVRAVAAREEEDAENPLAAARRAGAPLARIFGSAPGSYGSGIEDLLASGRWETRAELGAAYLAAASHVYAGPEGAARDAAGAYAARVAGADLLVHVADDPSRDLLEGGGDLAFLGGFAAAAESLGAAPAVAVLDTSRPAAPRARPLERAIARVVRGRALDPRFIAGQMRHGPRGAAELAETVDRLVGFAETTGAVAPHLLDLVHAAYVEDAAVRAFLLAENPAAAGAIAERLAAARRRGLWHARRNDVDATLEALAAAAREAVP